MFAHIIGGMSVEALMHLSWAIMVGLGALIPLSWFLLRKVAKSHNES